MAAKPHVENLRPKSGAQDRLKAPGAATLEPQGRSKDTNSTKPDIKILVKPVSNAINIIRYLSVRNCPTTTTQTAQHLKINASTCFNIMRTLTFEGVLEFDPTTKTYKVGLELGKLAGNVIQQSERVSATRPLLHGCAEELAVTMALWRRIGEDRMVLSITEHSSSAIGIAMREGQRLPVLTGATGRVVASRLGLSKREVQRRFATLRWNSAPSFESFWEEAKEASSVGWATDRGNFAAGIQTVAAPVFDLSGNITFTVVAFMFLEQFDQRQVRKIGQRLIGLGEDLSRLIY